MPFWPRYVSAAERRAKALREMNKLRKKGKDIQPVEIQGRTIVRSYWGKGWCDHLESFSDYENRLPRGRTYVRNGSVCHLEIHPGRIEAMVSGSSLYKVSIRVKKLKPAVWKSIKDRCAGRIGSMLELLQGKLSDQVMQVVANRDRGLFPLPGEIELECSCPDWAVMCKHVAATLYGIGSRLDNRPELLFLLRDVDAEELLSADIALAGGDPTTRDALAEDRLADIFGIDIDRGGQAVAAPGRKAISKKKRAPGKRAASAKIQKRKRPAKRRTLLVSTGRVKSAASGKPGKKTGQASAAARRPPRKNSSMAGRRLRPTGKSITRLRNQLGLSVVEFAEKIGATPASIYRWESTQGRLKLQERFLKALAIQRSRIAK